MKGGSGLTSDALIAGGRRTRDLSPLVTLLPVIQS